jgi:dTDP-4-amino-4,6-dideoxygalactose transaminase
LALPSAKGGQYWTENEIKKINEFIKSGKFTRGQAIAKVREFQFARPYG